MATDTGRADLDAGLGQRVDDLSRDMASIKKELVESRNELRDVLGTLTSLAGAGERTEPEVRQPAKPGKRGPLDAWFESLREGTEERSSSAGEDDSGSRPGLFVSAEQLASVLAEAQSGNDGGPALSLQQLDRSLKRTRTADTPSNALERGDRGLSMSLNDLARMIKQARSGALHAGEADSPKAPSSPGEGRRSPPVLSVRAERSAPVRQAVLSARAAPQQSIRTAMSAIDTAGIGGPRLDINLMTNLVRWVGSARRRLGLGNLQGMLETYAMSGHLPGAIQMAIYQAASFDVGAGDAGARLTTADDVADTILELHGIIHGSGSAPACPEIDFDIRDAPLTTLIPERVIDRSEAVPEDGAASEETPPVRPVALDAEPPTVVAPEPLPLEKMRATAHEPTDAFTYQATGERVSLPEQVEDSVEQVTSPTVPARTPATRGAKANGRVRKPEPASLPLGIEGSGTRRAYPSDVTDGEWRRVESLVPPPKSGGRPCKYDRREILNGILYQLRTNRSWRSLPQDLPPWKIVHHYYRTWREDGAWLPVAQTLGYVRDDEADPPDIDGPSVGLGHSNGEVVAPRMSLAPARA